MNHAQFPSLAFPLLDKVELPDVTRVRFKRPASKAIENVEEAVRGEIQRSDRLKQMPQGASIAVAVGSRGIAKIDVVARATIQCLREMGHSPYVVPAMGSHGGGTAEGQKEVLAKLGMTEESLGAEIRASMEVVDYGETPDGARCKFDKIAAEADGIVVINRVKSHTTFDRPIESGLVKMVAVGLGKAEGARAVHRTGPEAFLKTLPNLAAIALEHAPIALGIALVENAQNSCIQLKVWHLRIFLTATNACSSLQNPSSHACHLSSWTRLPWSRLAKIFLGPAWILRSRGALICAQSQTPRLSSRALPYWASQKVPEEMDWVLAWRISQP
jgi:hypothetical protein